MTPTLPTMVTAGGPATPVLDGPTIPAQLRATARRRQARAEQLRAWSHEAKPVLGGSLRRRAAELELTATALVMRAEGLEVRELVGAHQEEER
jgi:hypothetical protein